MINSYYFQAKDRVLKSPPKKVLTAREQILLHIRSQPKLKSVSDGQHVGKIFVKYLNNLSSFLTEYIYCLTFQTCTTRTVENQRNVIVYDQKHCYEREEIISLVIML